MDATKIKKALLKQKSTHFKGNLYHLSQVSFSYNSNKMEGSRLTEEQTEAIFNTASFIPKSEIAIKIDDLIEAKNHFKLFDYILDNLDQPLTKEMMIKMHQILKRNTTDEEKPYYNVGGFKVIPNVIGVVEVTKTTPPEKVSRDIELLLEEYHHKTNITIEDIIDFHVKFERIHPFADGNGRIGRIIMFKECLKNNLIPFIILDEKRSFYLRGLKEYHQDPQYLIDTCLDAQDKYEDICNDLLTYDIDN